MAVCVVTCMQGVTEIVPKTKSVTGARISEKERSRRFVSRTLINDASEIKMPEEFPLENFTIYLDI